MSKCPDSLKEKLISDLKIHFGEKNTPDSISSVAMYLKDCHYKNIGNSSQLESLLRELELFKITYVTNKNGCVCRTNVQLAKDRTEAISYHYDNKYESK